MRFVLFLRQDLAQLGTESTSLSAYTQTVVVLRFEDGSPDVVLATEAEADDLYEALWRLSSQTSGAVSAAAKIVHARHVAPSRAHVEALTVAEGHAVREALAPHR